MPYTINAMSTKEPDGRIVITDEDAESVYRQKQLDYHILDAKNAIENMMENTDELESHPWVFPLSRLDNGECDDLVHDMAVRFEDEHDCNVADNTLWEQILDEYVAPEISKTAAEYILYRFPEYIAGHPDAWAAFKHLFDRYDSLCQSIHNDEELTEFIIDDADHIAMTQSLYDKFLPLLSAVFYGNLLAFYDEYLPVKYDIEPQSDEDLLCDAGDSIDNAVFAVIESIATGSSEGVDISAMTEDIIDAMTLDETHKCHPAVNAVIISLIKAAMYNHNIPKGQEPEWDMSVIGDATDMIETFLETQGLHVCRPWQDDEECICWSTNERCPWCTRGLDTEDSDEEDEDE